MAGLTKHVLDNLPAELTSGVVPIDVGRMPEGYVRFDSWPKASAPTYGVLTDPVTGQKWRIIFNQNTKRWEVIDD
jgi:hypothetical protein